MQICSGLWPYIRNKEKTDSVLCIHCLKNDTALAYYNFEVHQPILIIFGRNVAKKVSSLVVFYFSYFTGSPNYCFCATWGNRKLKIAPSLKCWMLFCHDNLFVYDNDDEQMPNTFILSLGHSWSTFRLHKNWLYIPNKTQESGIACCLASLSWCLSLCQKWE